MNNDFHKPVLTTEVLAHLQPSRGLRIIDATVGGGGHTKAFLAAGATVLGIDQDSEAINHLQKDTALEKLPLTLINDNFTNLNQIARKHAFYPVDVVLFDLGVSSHQLDTMERGFSFQADAPLDMRLSQSSPETASDLVNQLSTGELYELLIKNVQEKHARQIADALVRARSVRPITTTKQLADIVSLVYKEHHQPRGHLHPATKTFLALRITVNKELKNIEIALPQAYKLLKPGGKLAVISFHEGEDRLVKQFFKSKTKDEAKIITKKPLIPSREEISTNPRSRSAKLRIIEKMNNL